MRLLLLSISSSKSSLLLLSFFILMVLNIDSWLISVEVGGFLNVLRRLGRNIGVNG